MGTMTALRPPAVVRSRAGIAVPIVGAVVLGLGFAAGTQTGLAVLGPVLVALAAGRMLLGNPRVVVGDDDITVVNPLRTYRLSYAALRDVQTRWALALVTDERTVVAWAAPGSSGRRTAGHDEPTEPAAVPRSAVRADGTVGPGDLPGTASGDAATQIRRRWEALRGSGMLDDAPVEPVTVRWNVAAPALVVGAVLIALALQVLRR